MTDHSNQNGRLWPYVYFDLSKRRFGGGSSDRRGASIMIDSIKTANGQWPPRDGYTYSAWIHIDQFSVEEEQRMLLPSAISSAIDTPTASSAPSSAAVLTCRYRSINYLLDSLPQQCPTSFHLPSTSAASGMPPSSRHHIEADVLL